VERASASDKRTPRSGFVPPPACGLFGWAEGARICATLVVVKPLCVLVTGDPVTATRRARGGFAQLIRDTTGSAWAGSWVETDCRTASELDPLDEVAGIVVTGSSSSVMTHDAWMLRGARYLREAVEAGVPVLGICFGHQLLAEALGGAVRTNASGREIGTVEVELHADDPVLDSGERPFLVNMSHVDSVVRLPGGARSLAHTQLEPHAAARVGERAWGVQFHPEFDGEVMRQYVRARRELIDAEGLDAAEIEARARDTATGAGVLQRFANLVASLS
jgi:GMP synthase (glutamine-hydrolysing)